MKLLSRNKELAIFCESCGEKCISPHNWKGRELCCGCSSNEVGAPRAKVCKHCCPRIAWCNAVKKNSIPKIILEDRVYGTLLRQLHHNRPKYIISGTIGDPHNSRHHSNSSHAVAACKRCGGFFQWYKLRGVQFGKFEYHNYFVCKLCFDALWPRWKIWIHRLFGKVKYFGERKDGILSSVSPKWKDPVQEYIRGLGLVCFEEHEY